MPIEFRCTQCQRLLRTGDETAGKQARCPECGAIMPIPSVSQTPSTPPNPWDAPPGTPPSSPFGQGGTAMPPSDNPYQSPVTESMPAPAIPPGDVRAYAAGRVAGPAVGLIVLSGLSIVLQLLAVVLMMVGFGFANLNRPNQPALLPLGAVTVVLPLVSLCFHGLIVLGAVKMMRLQSRGWAMAAAVLALVPFSCFGGGGPCCLPIWLIEMGFGIWALVVLSDPHVKSAFPG